MERYDILLQTDNDLDFINDDFKIDDSSFQEIKSIIEHAAGDFKQYPKLGCGIISQLNGIWNLKTKQKIQNQLLSDGFQNIDVKSVLDELSKLKISVEHE